MFDLIGAGAGIAGGLLGGLMGGDQFDPIKYMENFLFGGDGQGGLTGAYHRHIDQSNKVYDSLIKQSKSFGKGARRDIRDWTAGTTASTAQSMSSRGLYNTSIMDSASNAIGEQGQRMTTDLNEGLMKYRGGLKLQKFGSQMDLFNTLHNYQFQLPLIAAGAAPGMNQRADAAGGAWSQLFTEILGGLGHDIFG